MKHEIDAANQSLGRLASKIAILLRGKFKATYYGNYSNNKKYSRNVSVSLAFVRKSMKT